jgi:hypothetical protein
VLVFDDPEPDPKSESAAAGGSGRKYSVYADASRLATAIMLGMNVWRLSRWGM